MEITEVKIFPVEEEKKLKAYVTVKFDNCFIVKGIKIIRGIDRVFIAMPSKKLKYGSFMDLCHPTNESMRRHIEDAVMNKYKKVITKPA